MPEARWDSPRAGVRRCRLSEGDGPLSYRRVLALWRGDEAFRRLFIDLLADSPFACYRFETPPLTQATAGEPFEFVLVDSPDIDLPPDASDFDAHFRRSADDVLVFANLGGDALMVVPRPREGVPGYAHIAAFTRHAPLNQQLSLWRTVARTVESRLAESPLWLSTAGGGVPWLHLRLDSRPKYYAYEPYRRPPG